MFKILEHITYAQMDSSFWFDTIILFVLNPYVPVKNFSVMLRQLQVFQSSTSTKQRAKCQSQGHNAVPPVSLESTTLCLFDSLRPINNLSVIKRQVFLG